MQKTQDWVSQYGITHPVVLDDGWRVTDRFGPQGVPSMTLLKPGLELVVVDGYVDASTIEGLLPQ
jgi:hypothetical protein